MVHRVKTRDNEWYNEWEQMTTNDEEWYNEWQRVTTSSTASNNEWCNEWQRMTLNDSEWQWVTMNDNEWCNEWQREAQRMKAKESDFRFQNKTVMQCITTIYLATSFWKNNVKPNICRTSHRTCSIKRAAFKKFALFTGKQLKACKKKLYQKETPIQVLSCEYCKIFKNTYFEEHLRRLILYLFLIKTRDDFASAKIFIK